MTTEASAVNEADTEGKQKASTAEPEPENKQKPEAAASDPEGEPPSNKAQEQDSEPGPADVVSSPEEEQLKPRTRTSAGKGLSRLFTSFLKRRSQGSEGEGYEAEKAKEDRNDKEERAEKVEEEKHPEVKSEEKEAKAQEATAEVKKEEKVEEKQEKTEKRSSKKKKKEIKKKVEVKKDEGKVKQEEKKEEAKEETTAKNQEEKVELKAKEEAVAKDGGKEKGEGKEVKKEVKIDKKEAKKKEKEEKEKKKEEEKAKKKEEEKAREAEKAKKKEQEKSKKKEEEKAKEAKKKEEKAKEEKTKKKEEETTKKEEETTKKEEEKKEDSKEAKKEEEEPKQKEEKTNEESVKKEDESKEESKREVKDEKKTDDKPKKEEEKGKKKDKGKKGKKEGKVSAEEQVKAPIAAPEPELKTEPDMEQALDQHSLSSAEMQQAQEEHKEDTAVKTKPDAAEEEVQEAPEQKEAAIEEDKELKEEKKSKLEGKKATKSKKTEEAKGSKRQKTMQCKVTLLDDALFECELDKHAKGQELLNKVCDHLNLLEKDYFGLTHWETPTSKTWIDPTKELRKQATGGVYDFTFNVKFYPPDPAQLTEDLTRYCLCLQLRKDIMQGVLPCSFVTLSLLGSYMVQSELGEYDPELHGPDYVKDLNLAPGQSKELEEKVMELHRTYRSMSPAQADLLFLENAKKLAMYGVDLHQAKDLDGVDITLGVCSSGLMVYKDKLRINRFPWPKVLKISYKRSSFFIKIRPSEQEQYESTIGFKLPNYKASKKLWKVCVEHHTFFRVSTVEHPSSCRLPVLGSKFRFSGRTQAQTRQASSMIDRPAPRFTRSTSKRLSRNLDGVTTQRGPRPVSAPVFSQAALADAGIPMTPLDQPQTSTPVKASRQEERKLEVTIETVESSKMETVAEVKEYDKPNEDLLRHHASISELKRTFMEAVPESKPSEWDKRLSTHSPFRTLGINGQPLPGADGTVCISPLCSGSEKNTTHEETGSSLGSSGMSSLTVSHKSELDCAEASDASNSAELCDQDVVAVFETSLVPVVEVEMAQLPCSLHESPCKVLAATQLKEAQEHEGSDPGVSECSGTIAGSSTVSYFRSGGPQVIRCLQPPLVQTQTVTITAESNSLSSGISTTEVPIVPTQTFTYESSKVTVDGTDEDKDGSSVSSFKTVTSETSGTTITTTTTHISKVVKSGSSETRVEKRIVITADSDIEQDKGKDGGASAL